MLNVSVSALRRLQLDSQCLQLLLLPPVPIPVLVPVLVAVSVEPLPAGPGLLDRLVQLLHTPGQHVLRTAEGTDGQTEGQEVKSKHTAEVTDRVLQYWYLSSLRSSGPL